MHLAGVHEPDLMLKLSSCSGPDWAHWADFANPWFKVWYLIKDCGNNVDYRFLMSCTVSSLALLML